jgi:hypothetical protein
LQSDSNKFSRREERRKKVAIEGREHGGGGDHQQMSKAEIGKELTKMRARMEELTLWQ